MREASFRWTPGSGAGRVGPLTSDPESAVEAKDPGGFESLVTGDLSLGVVLVALLLAFGWGALHALSPGHGKSMVAAYLVGSRGTPRHALILGAFVTITHTVGVLAFGLVALVASSWLLPETLFAWLNLVAALFVVAIGGWVLWTRYRQGRSALRRDREPVAVGAQAPQPRLALVAAGGAHEHDHAESHDHGHSHAQGHVHRHHGHDHHLHDHEDSHAHAHGDGHRHHDHHHDHGDHHHDHGGKGHSHAPPQDLSMRSLMAVGAAAGILPCPSALVLLLGAISLQRVGYGLVLVLAFSLGLAAVLSLIGVLVLKARRLVDRLPLDGRLAAAVPALAAAVIVVLGVVLTLRAVPGIA